jgi:DhnA family fructose-bisphosphate aldolase class Ia
MAESPGQAPSLGKTLRLARLFDPDSGTAVMLPLDHAIEEPDYDQLERPLERSGLWTGLRNQIWQSRDPVGPVRAVSAVIRHGAGVDDAMGLLAADAAS